jgi:hypothetical protein
MERVSIRGSLFNEGGGVNLAASMMPGAIWLQLPPQELLVIVAPDDPSPCALRQQHFARLFLQQDAAGALSTPAASGASDEKEKSITRHADRTARANGLDCFPINIPCERSIPRNEIVATTQRQSRPYDNLDPMRGHPSSPSRRHNSDDRIAMLASRI